MTEVESFELTSTLFQALLNMTAELDAYTDKTKALVCKLHQALIYGPTRRWKVDLTEEETRTMHYFVRAHGEFNPGTKLRYHNLLCQQSAFYEKLEQEWEEQEKAARS